MIEIELESEPMKARLYYLRDRLGKAAVAVTVKSRRSEESAATPAVPAAPAAK